jgi:8-oxo-dGTP diphosphatase
MVDQTNKQHNQDRPKVGLGVIVVKNGKILLGKRKGSHGEKTWALPGGHLEFEEAWETCAARETLEETGARLEYIRHVGTTNDIMHEKHYITIFMQADYKDGAISVREPDKCESWNWFTWEELPSPLFHPLQQLVDQGYHPLATQHDKLVRDKIIDIIKNNNESAIYTIASETEYKRRLQKKLMEEVYEYLESEDVKELADVLEVINALTATHGISREELYQIQQVKKEKRGEFEKRIILKETR